MFKSNSPDTSQTHWERDVLEKIALQGIKEQRRARRWGLLFKFFLLAYFAVFLFLIYRGSENVVPKYDALGQDVPMMSTDKIAMVRLSGTIAAGEEANAEELNRQLNRAFLDDEVKSVMILANSGGGSPVQSSLVFERIRELKAIRDIPVIAVVTDMCASGCYFIVSAADKIYANPSSIVGSIGVISPNYGVLEAMDSLGIKRRTMTSGQYKDFLDPTKPENEAEKAHMQTLLNQLHQQFIAAVKLGRGERLLENEQLFTGLFWTGETAKDMGLIDDLKTPLQTAEMLGGHRVVDMMPVDPVKRLLKDIGMTAKSTAAQTIRSVKTNADELILK